MLDELKQSSEGSLASGRSADVSAIHDLRVEVATACRVLAARGLMSGILGHVSVRSPDGHILVRCRGRREAGVIRTEPDAIRLVDLDGQHVEDSDGYDVPKELPLHTGLYQAHPDVGAVVHAHPRYALLCGLAGLTPSPIFGAYNIPALHLALAGVPVYPRAVLITRNDLADEVATAMGDATVCILKGHGIVTTGPTLEAAAMAALNLEDLLAVTVSLAMLGAVPDPVPDDDLSDLPDLGGHFNDTLGWQAAINETFVGGGDWPVPGVEPGPTGGATG